MDAHSTPRFADLRSTRMGRRHCVDAVLPSADTRPTGPCLATRLHAPPLASPPHSRPRDAESRSRALKPAEPSNLPHRRRRRVQRAARRPRAPPPGRGEGTQGGRGRSAAPPPGGRRTELHPIPGPTAAAGTPRKARRGRPLQRPSPAAVPPQPSGPGGSAPLAPSGPPYFDLAFL